MNNSSKPKKFKALIAGNQPVLVDFYDPVPKRQPPLKEIRVGACQSTDPGN